MIQFARGFLISEKGQSRIVPHWWKSTEWNSFAVSFDPRLVQAATETVLLIGHTIDVATGTYSPAAISTQLTRALSGSLEAFQSKVNDLCGRFLIAYVHDGSVRIQTDAVGMRSVFYTAGGVAPYIGSHELLVSNQVNSRPSVFGAPNFLKANNLAVMPGKMTRFEGVLALTPNTFLDVSTRVCARFYSGIDVASRSVLDAAQELVRDAHYQMDALRAWGPVRLSLSAGLDSRASAALLRPIAGDIEFFTYDIAYRPKNKASQFDRDTATGLAARFNWNHQVLEISSPDVPRPIKEALLDISRKSHSHPLAFAYYCNFPGGVHVRSNVYEIGRSYYQNAGFSGTAITGEGLLSIVSNRKSVHRESVAAFEEFIEETALDTVEAVDPLDMFYWEHRMGRWMNPIINESDIAHPTHVLVNSRKSLASMLGVRKSDRDSGAILDSIIRTEWPELYELPVNGSTQ